MAEAAGPQGRPAAGVHASEEEAGVDSSGRAAGHDAAEPESAQDSVDWRAQRKHFFVLTNAGAFASQISDSARFREPQKECGACCVI